MLSNLIVLMGLLGNRARNLIICGRSLTNATFRVEMRQICDHLVETSINIIK